MSTQTTRAAYPFNVVDPFVLPVEFDTLRADDPVPLVRVATGDEVWLVTTYDDVRAVLNDRRFSRNVFRPDAARLIPGVPVGQLSTPFVDPPAHTRWRKLMARAFTPRYVEGLRANVQTIVDRLVDDIAAQAVPVDLVRAFAYPLPIATICELFGIKVEEHEPFASLADRALTVGHATMDERVAAFDDMARFAADLVATKRARPGDDLLSRLIAVHDEDEGRLTEKELAATILTLLIGGYESTVNQIGKAMLALFRHPEQLTALRAEPSLIGTAVEETLRYAALDSGYGSPRYATEDVPVGDVVIPRGSTVLVIRASANRDGTVFPDPDRFDITREPNPHVAFGAGPHVCLGAALARLELELGISTLVRRFPELRLVTPVDEVAWDYRITVAGPVALPVTW